MRTDHAWPVPLFLVGACLITACQSSSRTIQALNSPNLNVVPPPGGAPSPECVAPNPNSLAFCPSETHVVHLGATRTILITLVAGSRFAADFDVVVERDEQESADLTETVFVGVPEPRRSITPGARIQVPIQISTDTRAPSTLFRFTLLANPPLEEQGALAAAYVDARILPIWNVYLLGGPEPEVWELGSAENPVRFRNHANGLTIRFHNMDQTEQHMIRGEGVVPSQDPGQPLRVSPAEGVPGGSYAVTLNQTAPLSGSFYCGAHETSASARSILINQP